jgi:heme-degrading monooxygenase HmoA
MYLTMNRFKVKLGHEDAFEEIWRRRDSRLATVPGFRAFHLLRGETGPDHRLYASHTVWDSAQAFQDWARSEAFRSAHRGAGEGREIYLGPPVLEVFESVESVGAVQA